MAGSVRDGIRSRADDGSRSEANKVRQRSVDRAPRAGGTSRAGSGGGPEPVHESANFLDAPAVAHDNPALATRISNGNSLAGLRRCAATNGGDDVDPGG